MTAANPSVVQGALVQQGYDYSPRELSELSWGLRFTPLICMAAALVGLWLQSPALHFVIAALGILPFWLPASHPVDLFYNRVLRPLWSGVRLPPNPLPRRIACLMGGLMNVAIGFSFLAGNVPLAYVFGGILVVLQLIVITTHFCVASWMYELLLRGIGRYAAPLPVDRARLMIANGAILVDVREPNEFAKEHVAGARNVPLAQVVETLANEKDRPILVYCMSGLRSQNAVQLLRRRGIRNAHNLGGMGRLASLRDEPASTASSSDRLTPDAA